MKTITFILFPIFGCVTAMLAETEQPAPTTARIIGVLPDGTPPPPEPPKPAFIVASKDILDTHIHEQSGRKIIVREINPIALPPSPTAKPPLDKNDPAVQARIAAIRAKHPRNEMVRIGATVYRTLDSTTRTLITYWPNTDVQPITLWSSADFSLLWGFASFVGSDGKTRSLMMTWGILHIDHRQRLLARLGKPYLAPKIPDLPLGKASFVIDSGNLTVEGLATIQSLHDLYNNEYDRLLTAYQSREQAKLAREAELRAHPPTPKDLILNYSLTDSATQPNEKGTAR